MKGIERFLGIFSGYATFLGCIVLGVAAGSLLMPTVQGGEFYLPVWSPLFSIFGGMFGGAGLGAILASPVWRWFDRRNRPMESDDQKSR